MPPLFGEVMDIRGWVLAFDTSEDYGSIALARVDRSGGLGDLVVGKIDERRAQASQLVPTIRATLTTAGIGVGDLSAVAVGAGPGSFTGVRVAASTAKGLVFGVRIPLWTPSSLEGAAMDPSWGASNIRAVAFDARGDRVYAAIYTVTQDRPPQPTLGPVATTLGEFAELALECGADIAGSAPRRHRDRTELNEAPVRDGPCGDPSAVGLIRALALDPGRPAAENPWDFEPLYLRGSSAQPSQPPVSP